MLAAGMALEFLDPFNIKRQFDRFNDVRDFARDAVRDLDTLRSTRRALMPLPLIDGPRTVDTDVFPPLERDPIPYFQGKRIGLVTSGGSGACVAVVGVARALEEAGIEPAAISVCSGSALWGTMLAAGLSAQEMADFSLSWHPEDYLDIQWAQIPRFALSAMRGFTGLAKGEAVEQLFDRRLWHMSAGETPIPLYSVVYNMDLGQVEYFGSTITPDLSLGEMVRIAVALPLFVEAVPVGDHLYVDGGVVELFPSRPLEDRGDIDLFLGVNVILPPGFGGEDITGWTEKRMGFLEASRQLRQATHRELARQAKERLGERLILLDPVPHSELHGIRFYDLFIDRAKWPRLMRQAYEHTREQLEAYRDREPAGRSADQPPSLAGG